ncbi:glycosyltransferase family 4 protein [Candidatus Fermentibacterales bacterium]|nr:glycosyltransferase family 4 protein [Candidatus Fermentibacterales bacterium]
MLKLLYVSSTLRSSGPVSQLLGLIRNLDRDAFEPYLVTLSPEPERSRWEDFASEGVRLHSLGLSRLGGALFARRRLRGLLEAIGPDLVHSHGLRPDAIVSRLSPGVPWFLTAHNYPLQDFPMRFGRVRGMLMARCHLSVMRKCRNVIACSRTVARLLEESGIEATPVQNGVDACVGDPAGAPGVADLERPVFVSVGNLIPRKNTCFLVGAFESYAKRGSGSLLVLGDGPLMTALRSRGSSRVRLEGNVGNVPDYLAASDCFVSASLSEGLPVAALESLAAGLPLLLSDIPSHREISDDCGEACRLFPLEGGEQALAEALQAAAGEGWLGEPRRAEALRVSEQVFSASVMSARYQEAYMRAVEGGRAG